MLSFFDFYASISWIDIVMHFVGGISIGVAFPLFLHEIRRNNYITWNDNYTLFLITIALIGLTVVCWEFIEFSVDFLFNFHTQPGLTDTMADMALGLIGGMIGFFVPRLFKT